MTAERELSEVERLREENERLARWATGYASDAQRYRFLRDGNKRWDGARSNDEHLYGQELDAAIDAAMAEEDDGECPIHGNLGGGNYCPRC